MSTVSIPPQVYNSRVTFNNGIIAKAPDTATEALRLIGASQGIGPVRQSFDAFSQTIEVLNNAGGLAITGDRLSVFNNGDIFNAMFQVLGNSVDNLAATAGGFKLGHGAGSFGIYAGIGAPGAAYPVTSGIPANGTLYFRYDGGALTTLYQVRVGAWVGIL